MKITLDIPKAERGDLLNITVKRCLWKYKYTVEYKHRNGFITQTMNKYESLDQFYQDMNLKREDDEAKILEETREAFFADYVTIHQLVKEVT